MTGALSPDRWLRRIGLLCIAALPLAAQALDAGLLRWQAPAGQPAFAQIELHRGGSIDPASVRARIAAREAYAVAGLAYHPGLADVQVSTLALPSGQLVLRLDRLPVDRGALDLLITVSDRMSMTLAEYHLNFRQGPPQVAPAPAGTRLAQRGGGPSAAAAAAAATAAAPALTATPAPAHGAAPAIKSATLPDDPQVLAQTALDAWAQAWSRRDVDAYLAAYAPDFKGRNGHASREDWAADRRTRILARQQIEVRVDKLKAKRQGGTIVATFLQHYRSDGPSDTTRKRVTLAPHDGRWLITRETDRR